MSLDLQDDTFHAPHASSGASFEDLLALFGEHRFFRASPPKPGTAFHWRADVVAGSDVTVSRAQYSANWSLSTETDKEDLAVAFLNAGVADMVIGTRDVQRTSSSVALVPLSMLAHQQIRVVDGGHSSTVISFGASAVTKVLTAMFDGPPLRKLDLTPLIDLSTTTGRALHHLARAMVSGVHDEQILKRSPKAMALLTEATLRLIFENAPHRLIDQLERHSPSVAPRHVLTAIDYMHANLHLSLTIIDIAEAVGVSERGLQLGFRKFRGMSPAAYLRRIRLDVVHTELSRPENTLPVNEVALKWGFTHMSRFAAQYRATFGLYPSETAKRAFAGGYRR